MRSGIGPCSLKTPPVPPAGKMGDAHGLLPGNLLEGSDGESAYTQARLKGKKTWVRIPRDKWPPEWFDSSGNPKYKDPVVVLVLALYGHPDAGTFWEQHCEAMLKKVGYVKVKGWASVFRHEELDLFLVVYVDDFKMHPCEVNLSHSFCRAAFALAFPACSFLLTGLATQAYNGGKTPGFFGRCERDISPWA